jgi:Rieske Fe-S protein
MSTGRQRSAFLSDGRDHSKQPIHRVSGEAIMAQCEVCGNDYYLSFEVITAGRRHVFDSFECAIQMLAPVCSHCGCKVIGHGIEANGTFYCCAHCARNEGATAVADRA